MPEWAVVVTGADGYIGSRVAGALLERGQTVVAIVRDPAARPDVTSALRAGGATIVQADLTDPGALHGLDPRSVRRVVHAAAVTRFNVDRETAQAVNVDGTRAVLEWAARCDDLDAISVVSTVYASGLRAGRVAEAPLAAPAGFANEYEWSKHEAERIALAEFDHLPVQVVRLATVIADDESGAVTQRNAFHNTLRLLYYGLLSLVPGDPDTPLHLVSGRYATAAIVALLDASIPGRVANVAAPALRLADVLDAAWARFEAEPDFRRRRVLRPLFADEDSFAVLARETESFGSSVVAQAMATMAPFARQLYVAKDVDVAIARGALASHAIEADDIERIVTATIDQLVTTRWGRTDGRAA